ncbi:hypothetical protein [Escherichia coli]|uniref:hypothetical protein n=1 Tax=Escherichia coli TaxID=562 RepID=UPI000CFD1763|nr:hypothetical protein [Escherichia coli]
MAIGSFDVIAFSSQFFDGKESRHIFGVVLPDFEAVYFETAASYNEAREYGNGIDEDLVANWMMEKFPHRIVDVKSSIGPLATHKKFHMIFDFNLLAVEAK